MPYEPPQVMQNAATVSAKDFLGSNSNVMMFNKGLHRSTDFDGEIEKGQAISSDFKHTTT